MTGNPDFLKDFSPVKGGMVTFGGGAKIKILGKGVLNVTGLPSITDVYLVDGLKANLFCISQFCDDNHFVKFNKDACTVYNSANQCVMTGYRSGDNCYSTGKEVLCHQAKIEDVVIWHQKLGHVGYRNMDRILKLEAVRGVPKLSQSGKMVCGDCLKGKQTKVTHGVVSTSPDQLSGTTSCFDLLHMDLMGPVEVATIYGKKYAFVIVDDFSRYTFIYFSKKNLIL